MYKIYILCILNFFLCEMCIPVDRKYIIQRYMYINNIYIYIYIYIYILYVEATFIIKLFYPWDVHPWRLKKDFFRGRLLVQGRVR